MKKIYFSMLALMAAAQAFAAEAPAVATFDDLELAPESAWYGDLDDPDYMMGSFTSGGWDFNNLYMADWASWAFFGYSNHTATTFDMANFNNDQFNCAAGHGADGSANYGVAYVAAFMGNTEAVMTASEPQVVPGMEITNSAWVVDAVLNGDGYSDAFGAGDYITLTVKGLVDGVPTGKEVTFYLVDYRSENPADWEMLEDWKWVSLADLGEVNGLRFDIGASRSNEYGPTTPTYFCLDNLGKSESSLIQSVGTDNQPDDAWYNLQGVRVDSNRLASGIYIHAGKKVRI